MYVIWSFSFYNDQRCFDKIDYQSMPIILGGETKYILLKFHGRYIET